MVALALSELESKGSSCRSDYAATTYYKPSLPEGQCAGKTHLPVVSERMTRSNPRLACYVISSVTEPPTDDDLGPEESLTGPIAAKDRSASSLAKGLETTG